jgi:hypothetical protein
MCFHKNEDKWMLIKQTNTNVHNVLYNLFIFVHSLKLLSCYKIFSPRCVFSISNMKLKRWHDRIDILNKGFLARWFIQEIIKTCFKFSFEWLFKKKNYFYYFYFFFVIKSVTSLFIIYCAIQEHTKVEDIISDQEARNEKLFNK